MFSAFDEIGNLESEIFLARSSDIFDEKAEHLLKRDAGINTGSGNTF